MRRIGTIEFQEKNGYLKKVLIFFTCDDNLSIDFAKLINKLIT